MTKLLLTVALATRLDWLLVHPLPGLPVFTSNDPPTLQSAELGRLLFYDKRLSADGTISCASCHQVEHGYSSNTKVATGIGGALGTRKPPPILNKAFAKTFFWDGRADTLEAQAEGPLFHPQEMGTTPEKLVATVDGIVGYRPLFQKAFGDSKISLRAITRAISDFERTLLSGDSLWDRWQADPINVSYPEEAKIGFGIFEDRDCKGCHIAPLFTDDLFHNTGVGFANGAFADVGRYAVTQKEEDTGAFKTPTLRNLMSHAPYMHDGSVATLEALVDLYDQGGIKNPHLDEKMLPLGLRPHEKAGLVAFMKTLEGTGFEETPPQDFPQ